MGILALELTSAYDLDPFGVYHEMMVEFAMAVAFMELISSEIQDESYLEYLQYIDENFLSLNPLLSQTIQIMSEEEIDSLRSSSVDVQNMK